MRRSHPFYLIEVRGLGPARAGLLLMAQPLVMTDAEGRPAPEISARVLPRSPRRAEAEGHELARGPRCLGAGGLDESVIGRERASGVGRGGVPRQVEGLAAAPAEIDRSLAVGEEDPLDRRVAQPARVERREAFDLSADLGEALTRNHASPSALTPTHSWVRASISGDPSRAPRQFRHAQFHCGQPPPAAEPSTWILTFCSQTPTRQTRLEDTPLPLRVHLKETPIPLGLRGPRRCRIWLLHPS